MSHNRDEKMRDILNLLSKYRQKLNTCISIHIFMSNFFNHPILYDIACYQYCLNFLIFLHYPMHSYKTFVGCCKLLSLIVSKKYDNCHTSVALYYGYSSFFGTWFQVSPELSIKPNDPYPYIHKKKCIHCCSKSFL